MAWSELFTAPINNKLYLNESFISIANSLEQPILIYGAVENICSNLQNVTSFVTEKTLSVWHMSSILSNSVGISSEGLLEHTYSIYC